MLLATVLDPTPSSAKTEELVLGAGCFWCIETMLEQLQGVDEVVSGYMGGTVPNPTYEMVTSGTTGHAEVVKVVYRPSVISRRDLLRIFFTVHNPTTLNRQ
ncbi:MAG: peptide-methionine (S)-S-oxide reductase, partial [Fimbriimonadaceae bacterium]|nr:peptide-methionine (S)-S-oxide reductase [Fimbriimonadaceae bacterium]